VTSLAAQPAALLPPDRIGLADKKNIFINTLVPPLAFHWSPQSMAGDLSVMESAPDFQVASGRTCRPDFTAAELDAGARRPGPL